MIFMIALAALAAASPAYSAVVLDQDDFISIQRSDQLQNTLVVGGQ